MGPTVVSGLPAHILLVHLVIALVPAASVLVVIGGLSRVARRWLNWLTPLAGLAALIAVPITTHAGHWLLNHLQISPSPAIKHHVALGNQMFAWTLALFAASVLVWGLGLAEGARPLAIGTVRRPAGARGLRDERPAPVLGVGMPIWLTGRTTRVLVALAAIAIAVGAVQQVYRTGEAGSRAVWTGTFTTQPRS